MTSLTRVFVSLVTLAMLLPAMAIGQTTWTGAAGDGLWTTAGNWSLGVPTLTTDAAIPAGAGAVSINSAVSVRNLSTARPLVMTACGAFLTLSGNLTLNSADITLNTQSCGSLVFSNGTQAVPATQSINGTGEIISGNGAQIQVGGYTTLNIAATITCRADTGNLFFSLSSASVVNNAGTIRTSGASRTVTVSGQYSSTTPASNSQFTNTGTIRAEGSASFGFSILPWTNNGTFLLAGNGSMNLGGRYTAIGTLSRTGTTVLTLSGTYLGSTLVTSNATGPLICSFTAPQSVTFSSIDGQITTVGAATLTSPVFSGPVTLTGSTSASNPVFSAGATLEGCGATLTVSSGDLVLNNGSVLQFNTQGCGALAFSQGTLATPATQSIVGPGEIVSGSGSSITIGGWTTVNIPSGVTFRADSATMNINLGSGSILNNAGVLRTSGASRSINLSGQYNAATPATSSQFSNTGTIRAENSAIFNLSIMPWTNSGTFLAGSSGTLNLGGRYNSLGTLSRTGATTVNLQGTYLGASLVTSDLTGNITCAFNAPQSVAFSSLNGRVTTVGAATLTSPVFNGLTSFVGTATVTNPVFNANATFDLCGASITLADGDLTINNASTLTFNSQGCGVMTISGPGTRQILGNGSLVAGNAASTITVNSSTSLSIGSGVSIVAETANIGLNMGSGSVLTNSGTLRVGGATRSLSISGTLSGTPSQFTNNGAILAQNSGSFTLANTVWTNAGTLSLATSGTMNLGGRYTALGTINRAGTNTLTLSGEFIGSSFVASAATGNLVLNANFSNTTFTTLNGATITFSGGTHTSCSYNSPVNFSGTVLAISPVFNAVATFSPCGATLNVTSGNLTLNANLIFDVQGCGTLTFSQGTLAVPAAQAITGSGTVRLINGGGSVTIGQGTTLNLAAGVSLHADAGNLTLTLSGNSTLNNAGAIRINGVGRNMTLGSTGSLGINNTGTILVEDRATASLQGAINNTGVIAASSGGIINVLGNVTQPAPGRLRIISTGAVPSTGIGRVLVQNNAVYTITGGTLEIQSTGPDPCRGEAVILSAALAPNPGTLSGAFGTTLLPPGLSNAQAILTINGTTYSYRQTNPADIAGANQSVGSDGLLTADDIIVYLGWFFANTPGNPASPSGLRADIAGPNQSVIPDGFLTADDIIVFLARYFAGCT